jgi:hypothetical protein
LQDARGALIPVAGNPGTVTIDVASPANKGVLGVDWTWQHACGHGTITAVFTETGVGAYNAPYPASISPLPLCAAPAGQLLAGTFAVSSGS